MMQKDLALIATAVEKLTVLVASSVDALPEKPKLVVSC